MIRYEVEKKLIAGEIEVDDLPDVWDDMYEEFLGIRAPNRTLGVLQDIHWSMGAFGYFPTYTLGNLYALNFLPRHEKIFQNMMSKSVTETSHRFWNGCVRACTREGVSLSQPP